MIQEGLNWSSHAGTTFLAVLVAAARRAPGSTSLPPAFAAYPCPKDRGGAAHSQVAEMRAACMCSAVVGRSGFLGDHGHLK